MATTQADVTESAVDTPQLICESEAKAHHEWVDLKPLLDQLEVELRDSELVPGQHFSLQEAMCAIELMDPKIDCGMVAKDTVSIDEVVAQSDFPSLLNKRQLLFVMDTLLAQMVTWWHGHSLPQTVFTCVYAMRPDTLREPLGRGFVNLLLKLCSTVRDTVLRASVYEEEDFITQQYGYGLAEGAAVEEVCKTANILIQELQREHQILVGKVQGREEVLPLYRADDTTATTTTTTTTTPSSRREGEGERASEREEELEMAKVINKGLQARINTVRTFLTACVHLNKPELKGIPSAIKALKQCQHDVAIIPQAASFAQAVPGLIYPTINHRLLAPAPPRASPVLTLQQAVDAWTVTIEHHLLLCHELPEQCLDMASTWSYARRFSRYLPDVVTRSRLKLLLWHGGKILGQHVAVEWTQVYVKERCSMYAQEMTSDERAKPFLSELSKFLTHLLSVYCYNRARVRRNLVNAVDSLLSLHNHAVMTNRAILGSEVTETEDMSTPLPYMMHILICDVYYDIVVGGFELELFQDWEVDTAWWQADYYAGLQADLVYAAARAQAEAQESSSGSSSSSSSKKSNKKKGSTVSPGAAALTPYVMYLEIRRNMCRGIYRFLAYLQRKGLFTPRLPPYGDPELVYNHRYAFCLKASYPPPMYYQYKPDTASFKPADLAQVTKDSFNLVIKYCDIVINKYSQHPDATLYLPDILAYKQIAKANSVSLAVTGMKWKDDAPVAPGTAVVTLERHHDATLPFPVIKVSAPPVSS